MSSEISDVEKAALADPEVVKALRTAVAGRDVKNDRAKTIAASIREVQMLDQSWLGDPAGHDDAHSTPWMPFPLFDFIALVAEALPAAEGDLLLEIGCGIGTRMKIAQEIFGLRVTGFDRVPEYVAQAVKLGVDADEGDALTWDSPDGASYGDADIIWFNRPFRDVTMQDALEARVWDEMKSGAVVICANLEGRPPQSWWLVLDDMEVGRGIWQKP